MFWGLFLIDFEGFYVKFRIFKSFVQREFFFSFVLSLSQEHLIPYVRILTAVSKWWHLAFFGTTFVQLWLELSHLPRVKPPHGSFVFQALIQRWESIPGHWSPGIGVPGMGRLLVGAGGPEGLIDGSAGVPWTLSALHSGLTSFFKASLAAGPLICKMRFSSKE